MGRMLGSDPDQLDGLGDTLTRAGDRLNAIGGEVSSLLAYAGWEGGDADDFRWQWHHQLAAILRATAAQSHEAARVLHGNAQEQRGASADHGGGSFGPMPGTSGSGGPPGFSMPWSDIEKVMLAGGLLAYPVGLLGAAKDGFLGTNLRKLVDGLPGLVSKLAIDDVPGFETGARRLLGKIGPLSIVSTFVDGFALVDHSMNGREPQAFNSGVNFALGVTAIGLGIGAAVVAAPAAATVLGIGALAVGGAQLAFGIYTSFDEEGAWNWVQDRGADISNAFDHAAHEVSDTVNAVGSAVGEAVDVIEGVVSGGLDAVGDFLGF